MNPTVTRHLSSLRHWLDRLGTWVAGFTFWRFVLFSLLLLIAGNIVNGLLFGRDQPAMVTITKNAGRAPQVDRDFGPATSAEEVAGNAGKTRGCEEDVRIDWSGVRVKKRCNDAAGATDPGEEVTVDTTPPHTATATVDLADWMLAVLAVLWIVWFAARARKKAEARADLAEAEAARASLERQVAEARLQALQAQVEPHFLFNTLGAVEHLIETDPPRAGAMQRHLIAFLRGAMPRMRGETRSLGDEFEMIGNFLAIMKIRMEDRLDYALELPPELACFAFPPMMLQSVVENAIKHGLEPKAEGGSLRVSARISAGRLRVTVADSGLGFAAAPTSGTGIGLANIRERLRGLYGDRAALDIARNIPTGTQVTIEIPHDRTDQSDSHHR